MHHSLMTNFLTKIFYDKVIKTCDETKRILDAVK